MQSPLDKFDAQVAGNFPINIFKTALDNVSSCAETFGIMKANNIKINNTTNFPLDIDNN